MMNAGFPYKTYNKNLDRRVEPIVSIISTNNNFKNEEKNRNNGTNQNNPKIVNRKSNSQFGLMGSHIDVLV